MMPLARHLRRATEAGVLIRLTASKPGWIRVLAVRKAGLGHRYADAQSSPLPDAFDDADLSAAVEEALDRLDLVVARLDRDRRPWLIPLGELLEGGQP
jgi:hypothetical protein